MKQGTSHEGRETRVRTDSSFPAVSGRKSMDPRQWPSGMTAYSPARPLVIMFFLASSLVTRPSSLYSAVGSDKALYEDSIQATKQSIAQETLDIFYHDALDYYRDKRY